jgi:hypothetical protein
MRAVIGVVGIPKKANQDEKRNAEKHKKKKYQLV